MRLRYMPIIWRIFSVAVVFAYDGHIYEFPFLKVLCNWNDSVKKRDNLGMI